MTKEILDDFGQKMIDNVRDRSISELDRIISGQIKGSGKEIHNKYFKDLPPITEEVLEKLIPLAVDTTIHYFLWFIEEDQNFDITMKKDSKEISIKKESDGLSGEIYTKKGWIARYSRTRYLDNF
jgi:hypothetical protein